MCGWEPRRRGEDVNWIEGELGRVDRGHAQPHVYSAEDKQRWHAMLTHIGKQRGYRPGWPAQNYKEKFGSYPPWGTVMPIAPSAEVQSWVRSRMIAYANEAEDRRMSKKKPLYRTPQESWSWHTTALKLSASWRSIKDPERLILERLEIEHERHAGAENGNLGVSWAQFVEHDVHKDIIGHAINRLVDVGLLEITRAGTGGRGPSHMARYRLTYLPAKTVDENGIVSYPEATNEWRHAPPVPKLRSPRPQRGICRQKEIQKPTPHVRTNSTPHVRTN
jgi:hypothetical protein